MTDAKRFYQKRFSAGVLLLALPILIGGCGGDMYTPAPIVLPGHIQSIAVRPIANRTQIVGLEDKLRLRVTEEFLRDGRLPFINNESEAHGVVVAEIANYIKEPISYDSSHIAEEFKLWVILNLRFVDQSNNTVLWEEPRMEQVYRYFVETKPGGITEDEAREVLWDLFSRDIVKRTIDGFGSVSGASERKTPKKPLPKNAEPASAEPKKPVERVAPPPPY
ncbi:MAG: hypothetical protein HY548_06460 [Elusimicrobia bacterium]|nr:hypothetical protein [Elusimicrobiota bacterium]